MPAWNWKAANGGDDATWADVPDEVFARAALTAIHPGLLDGSAVVVPREATNDMINAAVHDAAERRKRIDVTDPHPFKCAYAVMLLAAAHPNITPSAKTAG